jgi:hypothetical protein
MDQPWIEFIDGVEPAGGVAPGIYEAEVEDRGLPATARLRRIEGWGWSYDDDVGSPIDAATMVILRVRRLPGSPG